ncbi:histidinol-phosphate transaminase [Bdellovibrionota bacterium FG-1]
MTQTKNPRPWMPQVAPHIASLTPYSPGKPIEETEREYGISGVVKLASNENPLGPSPKAVAALRALEPSLHLYPDGSHFHLKKVLSERLDCLPSELAIGCGSNELIDLLTRVFVPIGKQLVTHKTAFVVYRLCGHLNGAEVIEVPIDSNLNVSVQSLLDAVTPNTQVVMIANPNNPTGTFLNAEQIDHLARELNRKEVLLVLDYAYWEYVTDRSIPDPMTVFKRHRNVLILRTFSKVYGIAGVRVGYLVGDAPLIELIERARQPFNVTASGLVAAQAALDDDEFVHRSIALNEASKTQLTTELAHYDVRVYPSQGNFLLVDFKRSSQQLYPEFLKRGVIIRPVAIYGLPTHLRITAGLPAENAKLFQALSEILTRHPG